MKIRDKNPALKKLIDELVENSYKNKAPVWKAVAKGLNRPRRRGFSINVSKIEKYAKEKEQVVVPGIVLGIGEIKKPAEIAAIKFSASAREKITKAGGKCLDIEEMMKSNPKGKKIRIMG